MESFVVRVPEGVRSRASIIRGSGDAFLKLVPVDETGCRWRRVLFFLDAAMRIDRNIPAVRFFIPSYNELTLFLVGLIGILIVSTYAEVRDFLLMFLRESNTGVRVLLGFLLAGALLCLYHVFTPRRKKPWEKSCMISFAIIANATSGIAAGMYMLENTPGLLIIFPIWNIANGFLLLIMLKYGIIDEDCIVDDNTSPLEVLLGSVVVAAVLLACRFAYQLHWAITFSVCVTYASIVNQALNRLLFGSRGRGRARSEAPDKELI